MPEWEWTEEGEGKDKIRLGIVKKDNTSTNTTDFPLPSNDRSNRREDLEQFGLSDFILRDNNGNNPRRFRRI